MLNCHPGRVRNWVLVLAHACHPGRVSEPGSILKATQEYHSDDRYRRSSHVHGYTLIEVLIVLSLFISISIFATFCYLSFYTRTKSHLEQQQLISLLTDARERSLHAQREVQVKLTASTAMTLSIDAIPITTHQFSKPIFMRHFSGNTQDIIFYPDSTAENASIWQCGDQPLWAVIINKTGRIRTATHEELTTLTCR